LKLLLNKLRNDKTAVICLSSTNPNALQSIRRMFVELMNNGIKNPAILICDSNHATTDENLIHYAVKQEACCWMDFLMVFASVITLEIQLSHHR